MTNLDEPLRPKSPSMRRKKPNPVPSGKRSNGFLWCRVCTRAWSYNGVNDPESWPQHRCGRSVAPFQEFLAEDPNVKRLPKGKGAKLAHDD